jgi:1,4-alpha-glucan branching enzyme
MHRFNFEDRGFSWIDCSDQLNCVIAFSRNSEDTGDSLIVICNFLPRFHQQYQVGVPHAGSWKLMFNSDLERYGGSAPDNEIVHASSSRPLHGYHNSLTVALPPLSVLVFKRV